VPADPIFKTRYEDVGKLLCLYIELAQLVRIHLDEGSPTEYASATEERMGLALAEADRIKVQLFGDVRDYLYKNVGGVV